MSLAPDPLRREESRMMRAHVLLLNVVLALPSWYWQEVHGPWATLHGCLEFQSGMGSPHNP